MPSICRTVSSIRFRTFASLQRFRSRSSRQRLNELYGGGFRRQDGL